MRGGENETFNLGAGVGYSINEVIKIAKEITKREVPVIIDSRRAGDPGILITSNEKITEVLNWQPQHSELREIITSAWVWHQKHPNGYER